MVRNRMMWFGDADMRVTAAASFVTHHKRQDARNVTLKRQGHQVVGYRHVVVESFGNSDRCRRVHNGIGSGFHSLQRQLDIANVMEVLVQNSVIRGSELAPEL